MIVTALFIAALVVAIVAQVIARGRDLTAWAAILICAGLLVGRL